MNGGESKAPARDDWPAVSGSTQDDWIAAQTALLNARRALLASIEKSHEESLFLQVPKKGEAGHGNGATRADTVKQARAITISTTLGQIALLKKSQGGALSSGGSMKRLLSIAALMITVACGEPFLHLNPYDPAFSARGGYHRSRYAVQPG